MLWISSLITGTANDAFFMVLPIVDNFWQVSFKKPNLVIEKFIIKMYIYLVVHVFIVSGMYNANSKNALVHSMCLCCIYVLLFGWFMEIQTVIMGTGNGEKY